MSPRTLALTAAFLALSTLAPGAQQLNPVLRENDLIGGEPVKHLLRAVIDDAGVWDGVALKNTAVHDGNGLLLRDGVTLASEGDRLLNGRTLDSIYALDGGGDNLCLLAYLTQFAVGVYSDSALVRGGQVILQGGQPPFVSGLPPGTICSAIEVLVANRHDTALVVANLNDDPTDRALMRFRFSSAGVTVARELLLRTRQVLPDGAVVYDFARPALSENGDWFVRLTTTAGQDRLLGGTREYLRSGAVTPIPGRRVLNILRTYALNDLGGFAVSAELDGDPATSHVLLVNGAILAQAGDIVPPIAPTAPAVPLASVGQVRISNSGNVYWQALIGASAPRNGSFMRDGVPFLQAGASQIAGELVVGFGRELDNFEVSPSGRFWIGKVNLDTTGEAWVTADFGAAVPRLGCTPNPGTLRVTGGLALAGSTLGLALDGPAELASPALVALSLGAARPGSACGVTTPFGELLIDPAQRVGTIPAGVFAGQPLPTALAIPASSALVNLDLFAQGMFLQPTRGPMLTNAIEIEIGAP